MSSPKQYNLQPFQNIPTTTISGAGTTTSSVTEIFNKDNITNQLVWTGTLNGTFDFQVSTNYNHVTGNGSWDSLPLSPAPAASGSAGSWTVDLNGLGNKYIKVIFTYVSGSGNLTSTIMAKAI